MFSKITKLIDNQCGRRRLHRYEQVIASGHLERNDRFNSLEITIRRSCPSFQIIVFVHIQMIVLRNDHHIPEVCN